jgi:hypothetical protein
VNRLSLGLAGLAAATLAACTGDLDPEWQLDHHRIIAVRATPPSIAPGEQATIDALLGAKGGPTSVASPEQATVVSPASLADTLTLSSGSWVVTAPDDARLAAARAELKLGDGEPVPLQIGVAYANQTLTAVKIINLGASATNPTLPAMTINGQPAPDAGTPLVIGQQIDVPLSIAVSDVDFDVTWLTSCGTMHDFDLPKARIFVETDDPTAGELAVVLRDAAGGVAWRVWPIHAE